MTHLPIQKYSAKSKTFVVSSNTKLTTASPSICSLSNFSLKVLYWINLNSIVLKRSHKKFWRWMLGKSYRLNKNKLIANRKIIKLKMTLLKYVCLFNYLVLNYFLSILIDLNYLSQTIFSRKLSKRNSLLFVFPWAA